MEYTRLPALRCEFDSRLSDQHIKQGGRFMQTIHKCTECRSEWWSWLLLNGKCRDCGGEVKKLKGGECNEKDQ